MNKNHSLNDIIDIIDYIEVTLSPSDTDLMGSEAANHAREAAEQIFAGQNASAVYAEFLKSMISSLDGHIAHANKFKDIIYHPSIAQAREFERIVYVKILEIMSSDAGIPKIDWEKMVNGA